MRKISSFIIVFLLLMVTFNCEEPDEKEQKNVDDLPNTLGQAELGGITGNITDYFYDLDANVNVEFYRFSSSYFTFDYEQYLNLFQAEPTTLSLRSFPEYLVTVTPNDQQNTHRSIVDSLTTENVVIQTQYILSLPCLKILNQWFGILMRNWKLKGISQIILTGFPMQQLSYMLIPYLFLPIEL
jgi:hypothetical protein